MRWIDSTELDTTFIDEQIEDYKDEDYLLCTSCLTRFYVNDEATKLWGFCPKCHGILRW